jgi:hypothetical protein
MLFAVGLIGLTLVYGLLLTLMGGLLVGEAAQRRVGALCGGLGLIVAFPVCVVGAAWVTPSLVLGGWVAALGLLGLRTWMRSGAIAVLRRVLVAVRQAFVLAGMAMLFWWPGAVGQHVGLFTEASGDFTIYAGAPAVLGDVPLWGPEAVSSAVTRLRQGVNPWFDADAGATADPPAGDWSMRRVVQAKWTESKVGWFGLQHVLFRVDIGTIEQRYLAILAILWAVTIGCLHATVALRTNRVLALLALLVPAGAHGIAAVGYNHYLPELQTSALVLVLVCWAVVLPPFRLPSVALLGLSCAVALSASYYPMIPLLGLPFLVLLGTQAEQLLAECRSISRRFTRRRVMVFASVVLCGVVFAIPLLIVNLQMWEPTLEQLRSFLFRSSTASADPFTVTYYGAPRPYDADQLASLAGAFGLQRLPPYWSTPPSREPALAIVVAGFVAAACATGLMLAMYRPIRQTGSDLGRVSWSLALGLLLTGGSLLFVGRAFEYTQFKAISYVRPEVFLLLFMPMCAAPLTRWGRPLAAGSAAALLLLLVGLIFFRLEAGFTIARGGERTGILDVRLSTMLDQVYAREPAALVLAYPPSAGTASLWELGTRDARVLLMRFSSYLQPRARYLHASDPQQLWVVSSQPQAPVSVGALHVAPDLWAYQPSAQPGCRVEHMAVHAMHPQLMAFDLRGGEDALLWLQADNEFWVFNPAVGATLELALTEHTAVGPGTSAVEVELLYPAQRRLAVPIVARSGPQALAPIHPDALSSPGEALPDLVIVRVPGTGFSGLFCAESRVLLHAHSDLIGAGQSVLASWSGVVDSTANDWIGIFPTGGSDESRLTFAFTSGGSDGRLELAIPEQAAPGLYELRMYARGTWRRLATSAQFEVR